MTIDLASVRTELDACPLTDRAREAVDGLLAEVQRHRIAEAQLRVLCEVSAFGAAALMRLADEEPQSIDDDGAPQFEHPPVLCVAVVDVLHQLDREAS